MEHKIGEIFEFGGEWYQCVKSPDGSCKYCDINFGSKCPIPIKECVASSRSDSSYVIFKKLKKVGEPYMTGNKLIQRYKIYPTTYCINVYGWYYQNLDVKSWTIDIEIKQTKEDMGDNRTINQHFAECGQTINDVVRKCYTENKSTQIKDMEEYKMHDAKEDIPEFDKVVDECLFGKKELKLKPFDLQKAKAGKPVCTRDGRKARIICFDRRDLYPIVALIECEDGKEMIGAYSKEGHTEIYEIKGTDLMMLPEKKEGWVNVYPADCMSQKRYPTKEEALSHATSDVIDTIKIEWEE